ncbi:pre-mRNA-splicing factor Spp381p [Monosporozyma servazzii]
MSIRHFRHAEPTILKKESQEETTVLDTANQLNEDLTSHQSESEGSESEEEDSSSSSSSSSEEEEIIYHKPVFLPKKPNDSFEQNKSTSNSTEESKKRSEQRIQHSLNVSRNIDINKINIDDNYTSTDKDLLKRTIELNDDDTVDPEFELAKWEERHQNRLKRERKVLVAKQLDAEEKQERVLKRSVPLTSQDNFLNKDGSTFKEHKKFKPTVNYKPQRTTSTSFNTELPSSMLNDSKEDDDSKNNEYSIL